MATNTRKLSDFLAEGTGDTFGDLPVGKPHIKPGILYPAVHGVLSNSTGLNFIDTGNTGHTINSGINQRAYHTTGEKKNGNSSIYFTGESDDELQFPDHADFNWGANADFTYEFFSNDFGCLNGFYFYCLGFFGNWYFLRNFFDGIRNSFGFRPQNLWFGFFFNRVIRCGFHFL